MPTLLRHGFYTLRSLTRFRYVVLPFSIFLICIFFNSGRRSASLASFPSPQSLSGASSQLESVFDDGKEEDLDLTDAQCRVRYPGLFDELDERASKQEAFTLTRVFDGASGEVQGRVEGGKIVLLSMPVQRGTTDLTNRLTSNLHSLERAVRTAPSSEPVADTIFTLSVTDYPTNSSLTSCRYSDAAAVPTVSGLKKDGVGKGNYWVMPHFSRWSWPTANLIPLPLALSNINKYESTTSFADKIPKAVWRGSLHYNPSANTHLRPSLLAATQNKPWADIRATFSTDTSTGQSEDNSLPITSFCHYKFIIYTEGVTFSGRLPYHRLCRSVLLSPPFHYLTVESQGLKPIYADDLLPAQSSGSNSDAIPITRETKRTRHPAFPISYPPETANIIFLRPDWSDLEAVIEMLSSSREGEELAENIARNGYRDAVTSGVMSTSAEVCYWRFLMARWGEKVGPRTEDRVRWQAEGVSVREWVDSLGLKR